MSSKRSLAITILFGLLGALVNLVKVPIFFGMDFLFGGAFSFVPAILYGPFHGAVANGLAGIVAFYHWRAPYTIVSFIVFGAIAGWVLRARRTAILEVIVLQGAFMGLRIVAIDYFALHELPSYVVTVQAKSLFNNMIDLTLCSLWLYFSSAERKLNRDSFQRQPMRFYIQHAMSGTLMIAVLLGTLAIGRTFYKQISFEVAQRAKYESTRAAHDMSVWFADHPGRPVDAIDLQALQAKLLGAPDTKRPVLVVSDELGNVVLNSTERGELPEPLNYEDYGRTTSIEDNVVQILPPGNELFSWEQAYFVGAARDPISRWTVHYFVSIAPYRERLLNFFGLRMVVCLLLYIPVQLLSVGLSKLLTRDLERFSRPVSVKPDQSSFNALSETAVEEVWVLSKRLKELFGQLRAREEQLIFAAQHDPLTQLANRSYITDIFERLRSETDHCALLFLDLDEFKQVNDCYGHDIGDELLKAFARRLKSAARSTDYVARFGGDEFFILMSGPKSREVLSEACRRLVERLSETYEIRGHSIQISLSIGVAQSPEHGRDFENLVRNADAAMYAVKEHGKNGYLFYSDTLNTA